MVDIIKEKLSKFSCDFYETRWEETQSNSIVVSEIGVEDLSSNISSGGSLRVWVNGGMAFSSLNDIDKISTVLDETYKSAKLVSSSNKTPFSSYSPIVDEVKTSYNIDPLSVPVSQKLNLCNDYFKILKQSKIQSCKVRYLDFKKTKYYMNSEGSFIKMEFTYVGIGFYAFAVDGSNVQRAFDSLALYSGFEEVSNLHPRCEATAKRAVDLLSAPQIAGGKYNVIIDPKLTGVFVHEAFGHLSEADHIYENESLKNIMKIGRRFGPDFLNIVDDGGIPGVVGYTPYDDEGIPASRTYLIKNGVLNARLHSRITSKIMDEKLSGNARAISFKHPPIVRMTNTFMEAGNTSVEELFEKLGDGFYVVDFIGGQTNLEMFTFAAAYGYEVRNGKPVRLVRDINITGNVFETLNNIVDIANDLQIHSTMGGCGKGGQSPLPVGDGGPHILVKDVLIGGRV